MVPSWPGSKDTAWWSERSQETAGQKESHRERERGRGGGGGTGKQRA